MCVCVCFRPFIPAVLPPGRRTFGAAGSFEDPEGGRNAVSWPAHFLPACGWRSGDVVGSDGGDWFMWVGFAFNAAGCVATGFLYGRSHGQRRTIVIGR